MIRVVKAIMAMVGNDGSKDCFLRFILVLVLMTMGRVVPGCRGQARCSEILWFQGSVEEGWCGRLCCCGKR